MFIKQNRVVKFFIIFLSVHMLVWTLIPNLSNLNLPLDTIEALAWSSDFQLGYNKHPLLSALFPGLVFEFFSNQDWAYYLLSQIFVASSFVVVWKFSEYFFKNSIYNLLSVLLLEGIYFYNFTTPEFNVYICQLPFWALTVLYYWKGIEQNDYVSWLLLGIFAGLGVLSHYLFFYLLTALFLFALYMVYGKKLNFKCLVSLITFSIIFLPHLFWLIENNFVTIAYALHRSGLNELNAMEHIYHPLIFLGKQFGPLAGFIIMILVLIHKLKPKINFKDKKLLFLFVINILPLALILLTSIVTGARIRTMWMTPFYLFFGVFFVYVFQVKINKKILVNFLTVFFLLFFLSPLIYYLSATKPKSRTSYPGKKIAHIIQTEWNKNFSNKIEKIFGNEWDAGNLLYNLKPRPQWVQKFSNNINVGTVVIGNYDDNKYVNEICALQNESMYIVLIQIEPFHNVCMIGKK